MRGSKGYQYQVPKTGTWTGGPYTSSAAIVGEDLIGVAVSGGLARPVSVTAGADHFGGIADKDYASGAADVAGKFGMVAYLPSQSGHHPCAPAYAYDSDGATHATNRGPRIGTYCGPRNATTGRSPVKIHQTGILSA